MASYLLVIGDREALGWILTNGRTAFPSAGRSEVASLADGDELFLYTTRGCFKNPTRDRGRVIGTATVVGTAKRLDVSVRFAERDFPVGCDLQIGPLTAFGEGVELAPLVSRLDAFGRSEHAWSIRLRRPVLRVSETDADLVRAALAEHASTIDPDPRYTRWFTAADG